MNNIKKADFPDFHLQVDEFRAALEFTQQLTGFRADLIEKDYFCSLVLYYIFQNSGHNLIFKGGTCLNKVYLDFYRLSEDLDFSIPIDCNATRSIRHNAVAPCKRLVEEISKILPCFFILKNLSGANNSSQYVGELEYKSVLSNDKGRIKVEIGLREELLLPKEKHLASTVAKNPFTGKPLISGIDVDCLSLKEAWAEKARAALTRPDIAIRDFFDFWHAVKKKIVNPDDKIFIELVRKKISISPTPYVVLTEERVEQLKMQVETDLRPVLNVSAFSDFVFDEAIHTVKNLLKRLSL